MLVGFEILIVASTGTNIHRNLCLISLLMLVKNSDGVSGSSKSPCVGDISDPASQRLSLLTRPWAVWQMTTCGPTPMWTHTGLDGPFHSAFILSPSSTMEAGELAEHIS